MSDESVCNTSKESSGELVDSLLGDSALNYICHRACVRGASAAARKERKRVELANLSRRKELAGDQERNRLHRAMRNGEWLSAVPHRLNGTEFFWQEYWDNLCLRYGLMLQDIYAACDGCGKKFSIYLALSCPRGGIILVRHDYATKEWGALGAWALVPSDITYGPKISSGTVRGERTRARVRKESGTANSNVDIVGEYQEVSGQTVNRGGKIQREAGTGRSTRRVKGKRKRSRLL